MSNRLIRYSSGGALALAVNYEIHGPYNDKFLTKSAARALTVNAELFVRVGYAVLIVDTNAVLGVADLDVGEAFTENTTYYVYACIPASGAVPVFLISLDDEYPAGYTADDSREIGSFQTDGSANIDEATIEDLRTADVLLGGVTDAQIPTSEISDSKLKWAWFQRGTDTFAGPSGVTVSITNTGTADYQVHVTPLDNTMEIGDISVESQAANSFVVKNSGSDAVTDFAWTLVRGF